MLAVLEGLKQNKQVTNKKTHVYIYILAQPLKQGNPISITEDLLIEPLIFKTYYEEVKVQFCIHF